MQVFSAEHPCVLNILHQSYDAFLHSYCTILAFYLFACLENPTSIFQNQWALLLSQVFYPPTLCKQKYIYRHTHTQSNNTEEGKMITSISTIISVPFGYSTLVDLLVLPARCWIFLCKVHG